MLVPVYKFGGRLANRLFIFAHLIAFSHEHNIRVRYPPFHDYGPLFNGTVNDVLCRYPQKKSFLKFSWLRFPLYVFYKALFKPFRIFRPFDGPFHSVVSADIAEYSFRETKSFDMKQRAFLDVASKKPIVFLHGRFFRDYSSLEKHQDLIRNFFRPIDAIVNRINSYYATVSDGVDICVGVHIRGEDYREFEDGAYFFRQEQYCQKLTEVLSLFPHDKVRFILCSNDPIDLKIFKRLDVVVGPGDPVGDLYTLAKCDYIIGPPSSFSLWASFYGKKPLCQLRTLNMTISKERFELLPAEILYNWSFPQHGVNEPRPR